MFYCITCISFVYLRMIRINNYKQKEGFMNQEMKQAIETFKENVFKDYERFQFGMWKRDIQEKPHLESHYNSLASKSVNEFKAGFKMEETKYYYKFLTANGTQQSVHSFIVKEDKEIRRKQWKKGDLLKCASWSQPALNKPRGNILGEYKVQWTGPLYLKGPRGFTL